VTDDLFTKDDELLELFNRYDIDGDGFVDLYEFLHIVRELGEDPSREVLKLEFTAIDANDDGVVDFAEFSDWWRDYR